MHYRVRAERTVTEMLEMTVEAPRDAAWDVFIETYMEGRIPEDEWTTHDKTEPEPVSIRPAGTDRVARLRGLANSRLPEPMVRALLERNLIFLHSSAGGVDYYELGLGATYKDIVDVLCCRDDWWPEGAGPC
jgi:hypothetical protein